MTKLLRKARDAIVAGVKPTKAVKAPKPEIAMPDDFAASLAADPEAQRHFDAFAPSYRRDYLEWITTAKAPVTRAKRIGEAVSWIARQEATLEIRKLLNQRTIPLQVRLPRPAIATCAGIRQRT